MRKLRPRTVEEIAFLELGEGARRWLAEASASGVSRIRAKMTRALESAALTGREATGREAVEEALGLAAVAGRFDHGDLAAVDHLARFSYLADVVCADEADAVQPGTSNWVRFGA
ncbi:hypothetical protein [Nocardia sp. NPDC004260]